MARTQRPERRAGGKPSRKKVEPRATGAPRQAKAEPRPLEAPRAKAPKNAEPAPRGGAGAVSREYTIFDVGTAGDAGAQGHYADPNHYAHAYWDRRHDIDYYVRLARQSRGPVLEYGVGNGRIALHVARARVAVEGIDLSRAMLADFERRLAQEPRTVRDRVTLHPGDMRHVRLPRAFPLVIAPFNAFLHLYDRRDVQAFLEGARHHLLPEGRLVFDVSIPQPADLARDPERDYPAPDLYDPDTHERVSYSERFEYDPLRQLLLVRMRYSRSSQGRDFEVPLTHRQFFPRELEALLHYNGFEEILFTADFTDQPADRNVDSIVVSCRPSKRS